MKILISDIFLLGQDNCDWKEGCEFVYAFRNLGHTCNIAGKNCKIPEQEIPNIANDYDLVIITENYSRESGWNWWNWKEIKTPKLFWAIDTHLVDFLPWIKETNINYVAFNNPQDLEKYNLPNSFWMPYAASEKHHLIEYTNQKTRDLVFIGGLLPERKRICSKFNIECLNVYGPNYVKEMQASKICFNQSMSYDINAKYFEILGSGSFMLTNYNENFHKFMEYNEDINKMFYSSEEELEEKIKYYLHNEKEREEIALRAKTYVKTKHTYENRADYILKKIKML
jgi:hypothetical protein